MPYTCACPTGVYTQNEPCQAPCLDISGVPQLPGYQPEQSPTTPGNLIGSQLPDWMQRIGNNLDNPAFWKLVAIAFVGGLLIVGGLALAVGAEIAGVRNTRV